jgi:mannosyl-glycoprotein endo-beta-N-acetylglucosaminidase
MNFFDSKNLTCKPISTLKDLFGWHSDNAFSRKYATKSLNRAYLNDDESSGARSKFLVCHDMRNNYLEDRYFQGCLNVADCFSFYHWNLIDTFIYFSHHLVTIPPESWINAAHENNCRIFGTFITEFDFGKNICAELFENIELYVDKLIELTVYYQFDGWLINIENKIEIDDMQKLKLFVEKLTKGLKNIDSKLYKVIWYDSVIENGDLKWQNELNDLNKEFFQITDGFFVNYTWKDENLKNSKLNAMQRFSEVFVGIDVFGRGCMGNGGFNCDIAAVEIHRYNLSYALFAPGWLHECHDPARFYKNSELFWDKLERYTYRRKIKELPLITTFSHASSNNFYLNGHKIDSVWINLNIQSLMPSLSNNLDIKGGIEWCFEDGFYGANCVLIRSETKFKLFDMSVELERNEILFVQYLIKESQEIFLEIDYVEKSSGETNTLLFANNLSSIECCKDSFYKEESLEYKWLNREFHFSFEENVELTKLRIVNRSESQSGKLGMLKITKNSNAEQFANYQFQVDHDARYFQLDSSIYLCVKFKFDEFDKNSLKYFNVFMTNNKLSDQIIIDSQELNLNYLGSTKIDEFFVCLKLNSNYFNDQTNSCYNKSLAFDILVQFVDQNQNIIRNFSNSITYTRKIRIEYPTIKIKDNESRDLTFVEKIISDFEFF